MTRAVLFVFVWTQRGAQRVHRSAGWLKQICSGFTSGARESSLFVGVFGEAEPLMSPSFVGSVCPVLLIAIILVPNFFSYLVA